MWDFLHLSNGRPSQETAAFDLAHVARSGVFHRVRPGYQCGDVGWFQLYRGARHCKLIHPSF